MTFGRATANPALYLRRPLKIGSGLVEAGGGAAGAFAWQTAGIKAAPPFPRLGVMRVAGAFGDRADVDIAEEDMPAVGARRTPPGRHVR